MDPKKNKATKGLRAHTNRLTHDMLVTHFHLTPILSPKYSKLNENLPLVRKLGRRDHVHFTFEYDHLTQNT